MKSFNKLLIILVTIVITSCTQNRVAYHMSAPKLPKKMSCSYNIEKEYYELDPACDKFIRDYVEFLLQENHLK